jgi:hypothetical protein
MYGTLEAAYIPGASWPCPARLAHISLELLTSMVVRCMCAPRTCEPVFPLGKMYEVKDWLSCCSDVIEIM